MYEVKCYQCSYRQLTEKLLEARLFRENHTITEGHLKAVIGIVKGVKS